MTTVVPKLARAMMRRDEQPNIELAEALAKRKSPKAVAELADLLLNGTKAQQGDAVKVLYELAARKPHFLTPHLGEVLLALSSKNSRVVWGTLTLLAKLTETHADFVFEHLDSVLRASKGPSVIGKDHAVVILCKLCELEYRGVSKHLLDRIRTAPNNQLASYAEKAAAVLPGAEKAELQSILTRRRPKLVHPTKIKRVDRLLKQLGASGRDA